MEEINREMAVECGKVISGLMEEIKELKEAVARLQDEAKTKDREIEATKEQVKLALKLHHVEDKNQEIKALRRIIGECAKVYKQFDIGMREIDILELGMKEG